jgi:hypothetical protein
MKKIKINIVDMLNYSIRKVMHILTTSKINDSRRQVKLHLDRQIPKLTAATIRIQYKLFI